MTKQLDNAPTWRTFSTDYPGYGQASAPRPRRRPRARRISSRRAVSGRTYLLQIAPLGNDVCMNVGARRVTYAVGRRLVDWLRSRGHTAFLY